MRYVFRKWYLLVSSIVFIVLMSFSSSIIPVFIREAIDKGILAGSWSTIVYYSFLTLLVTIISGVSSFIARYLTTKISQEIVYRIRLEAFDSIQRQSLDFFDKVFTGQLISRITSDAERISGFLSWRFRMLIYSTLMIGFSLYYMLSMNMLLSIISLIAMIFIVIFSTRYAMMIKPMYDKIRQQLGVLASIATNDLAGIKTIKSLVLERHEYNRFLDENNRFLDLNIKATRIRALYGNLGVLVIGLTMATILYLGGYAIANGLLTIGGLTAFMSYMLMLMWPLNALGYAVGDIQRTIAAAQRLFEIIDTKPGVYEKPDAKTLDDLRGEIIFRNVSFSYDGNRKVLDGIDLHVRPGEKIVIVGPPGSGKSTLLKLLARLYEFNEGEILIDGVDVRDLKLDFLRKNIVYVSQEPFIFNRSIKENIALGNPDVSFEEIVNAAKIARIHDFIIQLPKGYDTIVGERGVDLSGGQRQRIALARALVSNPKIILLDDPVSNLDAETEKKLVSDLKEILRDKTALIVTQRLSLISLADRIVVMDRGRIVEEGTHEELLAKRGLYYELYRSMIGEKKRE
ncbi:MAG: ABC transporter [Desulfurococcales archaeon ex4484_58]|nr:MAG: ABC transporter [Desulfurococcales archaeon ex4484_58]